MSRKRTCNPKIAGEIGIVSNPLSSEDDLAFRQLLSEVLCDCARRGKPREQIARELGTRVGRSITASILNDYTATTKAGARFPAAYLRGLCETADDDRLLWFLLTPKLRTLAMIGLIETAAYRGAREKQDLLKNLMEGIDLRSVLDDLLRVSMRN